MAFGRYSKRPKIKIQSESIDYLLEVIAIIGLLLLIALPLIYYNQLPDTIPTHYGSDGQPDGYGGKSTIWLLPIIGVINYLGMLKLNNYPHIFNYPQKINEQNAGRLYKIATRSIRILYASITILCAYLTFSSINVALGRQLGLGKLFTPIIFILLAVFVVYAIQASLKKDM